MKTLIIILTLAAIFTITDSHKIYSAENDNPGISKNIPLKEEIEIPNTDLRDMNYISSLEQKHKQALEIGNTALAIETFNEMKNHSHESMKNNNSAEEQKPVFIKKNIQEQQGDWNSISNTVLIHEVSKNNNSLKQIDMKRGEDGILYAAVIYPEIPDSIFSFNNGIALMKSTNNGSTWNYITSIYFFAFVEGISLLIESRNNLIADSTRLIILYNGSWNSDFSSAFTGYVTCNSNGFYSYSGIIAYPNSGNKFTGISAVSDGAFYQSATYFGVVFNETDNVTGVSENIRYFRTVNWGANWTGATIVTGFNDMNPSADYKEGSSDSVYIAVERVLNATDKQIRIISTPFSPSSNKFIYYLTNLSGNKYEKPCITIRQNSPAQQILVTCTKNKNAVYHYTTNAVTWNIDQALSPSSAQREAITFCSSVNTGTKAFSAGWVSVTGDSLFICKGDLGYLMLNYSVKINNYNVSEFVAPSCVTIPNTNEPNTGVIYASYIPFNPDSVVNVYFNREGNKYLEVNVIPQGLYNPSTNRLNVKDTVRIFLRRFENFTVITDSGKAVIDSVTFKCLYNFSWLSDGAYYVQVKHRNSLETWSQYIVCNGNGLAYNFTNDDLKAFGGNQMQIDWSPEKYAIYGGDVNQDGVVDASDLSLIENSSNNFETGYLNADINGDSIVDGSDAALTDNNASNFVSRVIP